MAFAVLQAPNFGATTKSALAQRTRRLHRARRTAPVASLVSGNLQIWTVLVTSSAAGIVAEKTRLGAALSAPLVTMLASIVLANLAVIPTSTPVYDFISTYLVKLAVPLLLLDADLRSLVRRTGPMMAAFLLGSFATVVGTVVAWLTVPLHLGPDSWKIAAMLTGRHIGGAVNYVAIADATSASEIVMVAGLAADNLVVAVYFLFLFALSGKAASEQKEINRGMREQGTQEDRSAVEEAPAAHLSVALSVSLILVSAGSFLSRRLMPGLGSIPIITLLTIAFATLFPSMAKKLRPAGTALGTIFMQLFFASAGASGSLRTVLGSAPILLLFSSVQIAVHLLVLLLLGRALGIDRRLLFLASNSNVGGPTTAAGMASSKRWDSLVIPALLSGILGYSIGTFVSLGVGRLLLPNIPSASSPLAIR